MYRKLYEEFEGEAITGKLLFMIPLHAEGLYDGHLSEGAQKISSDKIFDY